MPHRRTSRAQELATGVGEFNQVERILHKGTSWSSGTIGLLSYWQAMRQFEDRAPVCAISSHS